MEKDDLDGNMGKQNSAQGAGRKRRKGPKQTAPQPNSKRTLRKKRMAISDRDSLKYQQRKPNPNDVKATPAQLKFLKELLAEREGAYIGREPEKILAFCTKAEASLLIDKFLSLPTIDLDGEWN